MLTEAKFSVETFKGHKIGLDNILFMEPGDDTNEYDIEDIAQALSLLPRFIGNCKYHFPIAAHSVLLWRILCVHNDEHTSHDLMLGGLLYDAPKAYMGVMPASLKEYAQFTAASNIIEEFTESLRNLIYASFNISLSTKEEELIVHADTIAKVMEAEELMYSKGDVWQDIVNFKASTAYKQMPTQKQIAFKVQPCEQTSIRDFYLKAVRRYIL